MKSLEAPTLKFGDAIGLFKDHWDPRPGFAPDRPAGGEGRPEVEDKLQVSWQGAGAFQRRHGHVARAVG